LEIGGGVTESPIFVTGCQRSGTTLLEKLLGAQERISILSQPFPLLFVEAKRAFLRTLGFGDDRYPLGHLFHDTRYEAGAFADFLGRWRSTPAELRWLFDRMESYTGQYTRFTAQLLDEAFARVPADADFAGVVSTLDRLLAPRPAVFVGSKETTCEEFVPPLLQRGFRCALLIRDPRDVVASLNHGRGRQFGGDIKPTLFTVRSWRKSVAVALAMEGHARFHWCRYENLVVNPGGELLRLATTIGVDPVDEAGASSEMRDAAGDVWAGNSSFTDHRGVSASSVGAYRTILDAGVAKMIEATCLPELQLLGYETGLDTSEALRVIHQFREPYPMTREGMEHDWATPENAAIEACRLERLTQPRDGSSTPWFLFERAEARLREAFRP
jgi:hypothetical protein